MPPDDSDVLIDEALDLMKGKPMTDDLLFRKIVLSHVKSARIRGDLLNRKMDEIESSVKVLTADLMVLKDKFVGLEDKKVAALEGKVDKLQTQMTRVYAIAGAASLIGGWVIPLLVKRFFP